jgi:hypothetical protein
MGITKTYTLDLQDAVGHAHRQFQHWWHRRADVGEQAEFTVLMQYAGKYMQEKGWANPEGDLSPNILNELDAEIACWEDPDEILYYW